MLGASQGQEQRRHATVRGPGHAAVGGASSTRMPRRTCPPSPSRACTRKDKDRKRRNIRNSCNSKWQTRCQGIGQRFSGRRRAKAPSSSTRNTQRNTPASPFMTKDQILCRRVRVCLWRGPVICGRRQLDPLQLVTALVCAQHLRPAAHHSRPNSVAPHASTMRHVRKTRRNSMPSSSTRRSSTRRSSSTRSNKPTRSRANSSGVRRRRKRRHPHRHPYKHTTTKHGR